VLSDIPAHTDDRVLVDFRTADDAGVFRWDGGPALVQTVDFFTPIVDDPYTYGEIAAANALSDIYAMGGRPLTALAIAGFPKEDVDPDTIRAIFHGGFAKLCEAGVSLLGGHTVQDREIKFGYAVTGAIDPARILTNGGAKPGDVLFLTKPLGTGIVATAIKFDRAPAPLVDAAVAAMRALNRGAADALAAVPDGSVHACTDVTGFGLAGHASEMAAASGVTLVFEADRIPVFPGVLDLIADNQSGGLATNLEHFGRRVRLSADVGAHDRLRESTDRLMRLVHDPQTSGGLLIAASADAADLVERVLREAAPQTRRIGIVRLRTPELNVLIQR
jgi:selenide, water dikinase